MWISISYNNFDILTWVCLYPKIKWSINYLPVPCPPLVLSSQDIWLMSSLHGDNKQHVSLASMYNTLQPSDCECGKYLYENTSQMGAVFWTFANSHVDNMLIWEKTLFWETFVKLMIFTDRTMSHSYLLRKNSCVSHCRGCSHTMWIQTSKLVLCFTDTSLVFSGEEGFVHYVVDGIQHVLLTLM